MSGAGRLAVVVRLRVLAEQRARTDLAAASAALLRARAAEQAERQRYVAVTHAGGPNQTLWQQRCSEQWAAATAHAARRGAAAAAVAREQSRGCWVQSAGQLQAIERVVGRRTVEQAKADARREQGISDDLAAAVRAAGTAFPPGGGA